MLSSVRWYCLDTTLLGAIRIILLVLKGHQDIFISSLRQVSGPWIFVIAVSATGLPPLKNTFDFGDIPRTDSGILRTKQVGGATIGYLIECLKCTELGIRQV